ncbi:hypothetical protein RhiirA5_428829 [Rhizophagus irregularis]|uniref:Uncharacterized protein n=1 Tax=Rhizophagus irregularis TaxID=588596 RepID=A0A2N0NZP1_9GLOM|nr:hypothetical protein RhiirA5_428829 [Rhizophagus irregularis]
MSFCGMINLQSSDSSTNIRSSSANSVKSKLLAPFNGAEESELKETLKNQRQICIIEILKPKGYVLFYQQPDLSHSEEKKHYYQLTLSNEFWLQNGKEFGQTYIGMDSKHDLNNDRAPILVFVIENNSGSGTPLAFGLSNRENQ